MFKGPAKATCQRNLLVNWRLVFAIFLCIGITNEFFYCFGTKEIARKQLKISDIVIILEKIVRLIK